ncbi:MAG: ABC transporter ATP-binding protein [Candidatus Omnitrophota bacterium]
MNNKTKKISTWTRFNKYLYKYWKLQALVILLGLLSTPLSLLNPYLTKLIIDKAYGNKDLRLFFILAVIGGSVFIISGVINSLNGYFSKRINWRVHFDMTKDLFRHLGNLPLSFFDNRSTGEHIFRINQDVKSVSDFVCNTIPQIITLFPRLLFIIVIVFYLNWKLALFTALLVPVTYIHPYLFGKWLKEITKKAMYKGQNIFKELQEVFSHIHLVKALGKEKYEANKFEKNLTKRVNIELKNAKVSNISSFSSTILTKALGGAIALYGGYQVIKGQMTLGSLTAIMIYLTQLLGLLNSIGMLYKTTVINSVNRERLGEILDIKPDIPDSINSAYHDIHEGRLEFKNIFFAYKEGSLVLKNINFSINPASKIALVGLSGCGKTTILSLILRLYEPQKGSVLIDGMDIKKMELNSLKSQIAVALQEPFLWNDTIENNILYGAAHATKDDVVKAAKLAEAHDFIMNFPNKYDSAIGEMACKISEGQKQRIAVARALIKKPKILILDEAMSSVDSQNEDKVMENIKREFRNSTVISVLHRLSTVKRMDLVYFFENGEKVDIGTHDELLEKNPRYERVFASQIVKEARIKF